MTRRLSTIHDHRYRCLVQLLVKLRKDTNLSQSILAKELGLSQSDISKIENHERRLDALEIFEYLEVISKHSKTPANKLWNSIYESLNKS